MGVAALVLGIVSIIIAFIPFCGSIAFIPALIGLILGIVDLVKKNKESKEEGKEQVKKGTSIAGIILSSIALVIIVIWTIIMGAGFALFATEFENALNDVNWNEVNNSIDWNDVYNNY